MSASIDDTIYDFAIIGAGMAGASLAYELGAHARIVVLEAEDVPGYHTTGRSAAFWEECYGGPSIVPLTLGSRLFLETNGFLRQRGALYVGRKEDSSQLDDFEKRFAGTGVCIERIGRERTATYAPQLKSDWCDAIYEAACADIDVAALHQHYLKGKASAVAYRNRARVAAIQSERGGWRITTSADETYRAANLVNAAGAWADTIAQLAGVRPLGIAPLRRTVVQLRVEPEVSDTMPLVLDISGKFYFKSDNGRIWLSPHDETPSDPCDAAPEEIDVARAIDAFERATDWKIEAVERKWAGLRSFAPDRAPVLGPDPVVPNFLWFAGQGGFGIQTAPAAARIMAHDIILGFERDEDLEAVDPKVYDPARFYEHNTASAL